MVEIKINLPVKNSIKSKNLIGVRHYQSFIMFLTLVIPFMIRTSLSVAIISMTAETPPDPSIPTYQDWDNTDVVLSSFFWGYIVLQAVAGNLAERFGPKWFLFVTMIIGAIFNLLIPVMAASLGSIGVMICRVVQGLTQGFLYPSIQNLISRWTPQSERARIANFVYGGAPIGIAMSMPITGAIAETKYGWPMVFYSFGALGFLWAVIFAIFAANSPETHRGITQEERDYIESSTSVTTYNKKELITPWKSIFTSLPVWAMFIAGIAQCWGGFTLLTEIPSYMNSVMNFDINSNSQLSALPYVTQFFLGLVASPLADKLVSNKILKTTTSRKIFNSLACFLPALALIWLAFIDKSQKELTIVLLVIAVSCSSLSMCGYCINAIDLAPNYSGTILGIINGSNNIFSILGPLSVGLLGDDKTDLILWRKVFLLAAGIYVFSGIFYDIYGSAELQDWNDLGKEKCQKENKMISGIK